MLPLRGANGVIGRTQGLNSSTSSGGGGCSDPPDVVTGAAGALLPALMVRGLLP